MNEPSPTKVAEAIKQPQRDLLTWIVGVCTIEGVDPTHIAVSVHIEGLNLNGAPIRQVVEYKS